MLNKGLKEYLRLPQMKHLSSMSSSLAFSFSLREPKVSMIIPATMLMRMMLST